MEIYIITTVLLYSYYWSLLSCTQLGQLIVRKFAIIEVAVCPPVDKVHKDIAQNMV